MLEEYKGKVKLVFHHNPLPFHRQAMVAAEATWEAFKQKGNKGFWAFHDKIFENQMALRKEGRALLERIAGEVGLNMTRFKAALDKNTHKPALQEQSKLSNQLGARGTPAFWINGKYMSGARPFPAFKQKIDQAIKEAQPLVSKAGGLKKLYEYIIKDGKTQAVFKEMGGPPRGMRRPGIRRVQPRINIRRGKGPIRPRPR